MSSPTRLVIALTGSIGSGKSAVAALLEKQGATVIDADVLARKAVASGTTTLQAIAARFGSQVLKPSGDLDREALGRIVFADAAARADLEQIVHPEVRRLFIAALKAVSGGMVVYAVPLFFEAGGKARHPEIQKVITVSAPDDACVRRVMQRDGCSEELAHAKLRAQMPTAEKERLADFVIRNDGSLEQLERKVRDLYAQLCNLHQGK